jgi:N utilization substance protein A
MVTNELRGERIDVVPFADDPVDFIQAALQPARVREVRLDDDTGIATVVVSDYQLSLAIGKEGQNARLAARLTGWRIDIKSETQLAEEEASYNEDWAEGEWVENEAGEMVWQPAEGGEAVSAAEWSRAAEGGTDAGPAAPPGSPPPTPPSASAAPVPLPASAAPAPSAPESTPADGAPSEGASSEGASSEGAPPSAKPDEQESTA